MHWLTKTMADGVRLQAGQDYDPRNGMVLSAPNVTSLQYDLAGRQSITQTAIQQPSGNLQQPYNTIAAQRTQFFDADNHQTGMSISHYTSDSYDGFYDNSRSDLLYPPGGQWPLVGTLKYGLGPSGHPLTHAFQDAVNGNVSGTFTWDGDTALLGGTGASPGYINIQDLGLYDLANHQMFYVYWRNWHGRLIGGHISGCWDAWHEDGISALHRFNTLGSGSAGVTGAGGGGPLGPHGGSGGSYQNGTPNLCTNLPITQLAFTNVNGDGYDDGFTTFQGARTYDSGLGQWTTPDAYAGNAHDPMTQQPFMWNGNNPYEYSDPSGYDPYIIFDPNQAVGNGHVAIAIIDHETGRGTLYSQAPPNGEVGHVRQVVTVRPVTLGDVTKLADAGRSILSERTTASQDKAMTARADALAASSHNYNAITCNCDQFVKDILSKGDAAAANVMHLVPRDDVMNLMSAGFMSGHPGSAPNGFKDVTQQVKSKVGF